MVCADGDDRRLIRSVLTMSEAAQARRVARYSTGPRTNAGHPFNLDSGDEPRRRVIAWREHHVRPEILLGEWAEDVRRPALRDRGAAMHDEIGREPARVYRTRKHRQCHPVVSTDVLHLAALGLVPNNDLVTVDSDPHEADLWPPIRVNGHQVDQRS
jgi:hypothetical protein